MTKVIILGASIAGSSLAFLLSRKVDVSMYELRSRAEVGKKLCSNICTEPVVEMLYSWGFTPEDFIKKQYTSVKISTHNRSLELPINEFELDRVKLVDSLMHESEKNGAKLNFSSKFLDFHKEGDKFSVTLEKDGTKFSDTADIIVGADGATSEFARQIGMWKDRKHFLYLQGKIDKKNIRKEFAPDEHKQQVFVGEGFGYYSYVYPTGENLFSVGLGDNMGKDVRGMFDNYVNYLGVKDIKIQGALIPQAKAIGMRKNLFVVGDAACETKFSLGGIVPSMTTAEAVTDIILRKNYSKYRALKRRTIIHALATRVLRKLTEKDYEELFGIMENQKFKNLIAARDRFGRKEILTLMSPRLAWFSLKALLRK